MRLVDGILLVLQAVMAVALFYFQNTLRAQIDNTVKFEFTKREQAALVATLFAEWADNPKDKKELNRLTWETTLWLPDDLASEVNRPLANDLHSKDVREILVEIKGLMHGHKSKLDFQSIVYYPKK